LDTTYNVNKPISPRHRTELLWDDHYSKLEPQTRSASLPRQEAPTKHHHHEPRSESAHFESNFEEERKKMVNGYLVRRHKQMQRIAYFNEQIQLLTELPETERCLRIIGNQLSSSSRRTSDRELLKGKKNELEEEKQLLVQYKQQRDDLIQQAEEEKQKESQKRHGNHLASRFSIFLSSGEEPKRGRERFRREL